MELIKNIPIKDELVITIGEFDGLHKAHIQIIEKVVSEAKNINAKSAVLSFYPHPDYILKKRHESGYLTPLNQKISMLEKYGIDYLISIPFNQDTAKMTYKMFNEQVLGQYLIKKIIIGFDFKYGSHGAGSKKTLEEAGYTVMEVSRIDFSNEKLGSELVRNKLLYGSVNEVAQMLGRFYSISGIVISGRKVGRTLGFKTANLKINDDYQYLKAGVYAVYATINNQKYKAMCNIGTNPTFDIGEKISIEINIFDFDKEIYGENITVEFVMYIREERKFTIVSELIKQLNNDKKQALRILAVDL